MNNFTTYLGDWATLWRLGVFGAVTATRLLGVRALTAAGVADVGVVVVPARLYRFGCTIRLGDRVLTFAPPAAASWALVSLLGRGEETREGFVVVLVTVLGVEARAGEGVAVTGTVRDEVGVVLLNKVAQT